MSHFLKGKQFNKSRNAKLIRDAFEDKGYTNVRVYWYKPGWLYSRALSGWYIETDQFQLRHDYHDVKELKWMLSYYNMMTTDLSNQLCKLKKLNESKLKGSDISQLNSYSHAYHHVTNRLIKTFYFESDLEYFKSWNETVGYGDEWILTNFNYFTYCVQSLYEFSENIEIIVGDVMDTLTFENYQKGAKLHV